MASSTLNAEKIQEVLEFAKQASVIALEYYYRGNYLISTKRDHSPVTTADEEVSLFLRNKLPKVLDVPVVCEEGDLIENQRVANSRSSFWLVDPIDGTSSFIDKSGHFTVNIALVEDGNVTFGVIVEPISDEVFYTDSFGSAMCCSGGKTRKMKVSNSSAPPRILLSRRQKNDIFSQLLVDMIGCTTRTVGSSYKFCMIADGQAEVYLQSGETCIWDTGAGQALVEAAGGHVRSLNKKVLHYGTGSLYNPQFYAINKLSCEE